MMTAPSRLSRTRGLDSDDDLAGLDALLSKPASADFGDAMNLKTELPENHLLSKLESLHAKLKRHQARNSLLSPWLQNSARVHRFH